MKILFLLLLVSCVHQKNFTKPEVLIPDRWINTENTTFNNQRWWEGFNDILLDQIIGIAIKDNPNLLITKERIMQARAARIATNSALWPSIYARFTTSDGKPGIIAQNHKQNIYQIDFDASYELDLFGKNAYNAKADDFNILKTEADANNFQLTLIAEVVSMYTELRYYQHNLALLEKIAQNQEKIFALMSQKYSAGIIQAQELDANLIIYSQSIDNVQTTKNLINQAYLNLLTLLGKNPGEMKQLLEPTDRFMLYNSQLLLANPLEIINHRPDIKSAEFKVYATKCSEQSAMKSIFPQISISALLGKQNTSILPSSKIWQITSNIISPILNWGAIDSAIKIATSQNKQAILNYKQSIINALADVETKIYSHQTSQYIRMSAKQQLDSKKQILKLSALQYNSGMKSEIEFLATEIDFYNQQLIYYNALNNYTQGIISLAKALGL